MRRGPSWTIANYDVLDKKTLQPPYGDSRGRCDRTRRTDRTIGPVPSFGPLKSFRIFGERLQETCTCEPAEKFTPEFGLFWDIAREHRGQGFATEAVRALGDWAFDHLRVQRLVATTQRSNVASIAVMRRLGMSVQENPDNNPPWFQAVGILWDHSLHKTWSRHEHGTGRGPRCTWQTWNGRWSFIASCRTRLVIFDMAGRFALCARGRRLGLLADQKRAFHLEVDS